MTETRSFLLPNDPTIADQLIPLEDTDWWPVARRTPYFLERFPPEQGWQVRITHETGKFELPDHQQTSRFPAVLSKAELIDPQGRVVATATKLIPITGPDALEGGETQLRGRLYEALGLIGTIRPADELDRRGIARPGSTPRPPAAAPVASTTERSPDAAATKTAEAPPVAPAVIADETPPSPNTTRPERQLRAVGSRRHAAPAGVSPKLHNAVVAIAKLRKIDAPEFTTDAAAQAWLNEHTGIQAEEAAS